MNDAEYHLASGLGLSRGPVHTKDMRTAGGSPNLITISPNHFGETPLAPTDTYTSPTMRVSTTNLHNPEPDTNPHDALGQCIRIRHCDHAARGQKDNVLGRKQPLQITRACLIIRRCVQLQKCFPLCKRTRTLVWRSAEPNVHSSSYPT